MRSARAVVLMVGTALARRLTTRLGDAAGCEIASETVGGAACGCVTGCSVAAALVEVEVWAWRRSDTRRSVSRARQNLRSSALRRRSTPRLSEAPSGTGGVPVAPACDSLFTDDFDGMHRARFQKQARKTHPENPIR